LTVYILNKGKQVTENKLVGVLIM